MEMGTGARCDVWKNSEQRGDKYMNAGIEKYYFHKILKKSSKSLKNGVIIWAKFGANFTRI